MQYGMQLKHCNLAGHCGSIKPLIALVALKWRWFTVARNFAALAQKLQSQDIDGSWEKCHA